MKDLIIGDCHFGIKNNSTQWLEYQIKFFKEQFIPELSKNSYDRVIFLGDIFDIRYAINQYIGYEVKWMFREFSDKFPDVSFYIVAGNHDYYSPDKDYSKYNAYNLLFGYEFTSIHKNIKIIQDEYFIEDKTVFAPWYATENSENFKAMIDKINSMPENERPNIMYCHSDLATWPIDGRLEIKPKDMFIISGHIHNMQQDSNNNLYNIGSMFPINFSDVDTKKYFYCFDTDEMKFKEAFENVTTPRFIQFNNEEIFILQPNDLSNSYVRIFISSENINKAKYIERLTEIKKTFDYISIKIQTINQNILDNLENVEINSNITDFIHSNIPENLLNKYEYVKNIVETKDNEN